MLPNSRIKYSPLMGDDEETKTPTSSTTAISLKYAMNQQKRYSYLLLIWASLASSLALLSTAYIFLHTPNLGAHPTDLTASHQYISYEQREFDGAFKYNPDTGLVYRDFNGSASKTRYFGEPSPEMDDAWEDLLIDEVLVLTDEEAKPYTPELRKFSTPSQDPHFYFGLDVIHSLHCLNKIRKHLDHAYYSAHPDADSNTTYPANWHREHVDHCLDQLKNSVQCHADLAPVPLYIWQGFSIALGRAGEHTCRRWEGVRAWMEGRRRAFE